jgi:hypothetical protein
LFPLILALAAALPDARALSPAAARNNPVKGYLNVDVYSGVTNTPGATPVQPSAGVMTNTTTALNTALKDAYEEGYVAYFPSGTYFVNGTLKAHTETGGVGSDFNTPKQHLVVVGQKSNRPVIKLANNATGFNSTTTPKAVVEFMNFEVGHLPTNDTDPLRYYWEAPSKAYGQMIRDIIIDCSQGGANNDGAIGLYFNQAQNASIENVKVIATGALSGITALPGRGWGAVNIEVVGGQYGIDMLPIVRPPNPNEGDGTKGNLFSTGNAGSVVVGAKLTNQTVRAVRFLGFVPLVLVGFEITSATDLPIMTLEPSGATGNSAVNLIDGRITRTGGGAAELINNEQEKNLYLRNVYVTGTNNLIKRADGSLVTASGTWKRIEEYSFCATPDTLPASDLEHKDCFNWITGHPTGRKNTDEIDSAIHAYFPAGSVPALDELRNNHRWASLPAPTDAGVIDVTNPGGGLTAVVPAVDENDPKVVSHTALQTIINANPNSKIYLPKGIYRLTGPINLKANTALFGTARYLTRIEPDLNWVPTIETAIITTDNSSAATTYLGDMAVGVNVGASTTSTAGDWFVALHWRAGRNSMVHMGQPYRLNDGTSVPNNTRPTTNDHSLMKITNLGGGRWYFVGAIKTASAGHAKYRILEVVGTGNPTTNEPLWIYGLNPEHALGASFTASPETYVEFINSHNIRIYAGKSEFSNTTPVNQGDPETASRIVWFNGCSNVGMYGHGAIRNGVTDKGVMEFTDCVHVLATHITPQRNDTSTANDDTVRDDVAGVVATDSVAYPDVVALFKRGGLSDTDEAVMTHN